MGKLNVSLLRYLDCDDLKILAAIETAMNQHELLVPDKAAASIARLKYGGVPKMLRELCVKKLLSYERGKKFDGYRLTNMGYDYLALNVLRLKGAISAFGNQIGVGKESNIYIVINEEEEEFCLKVHRLGRTCFRNIVNKRDYHKNKKIKSWLYLSHISAKKEFAFMKALYDRKFPVPKPIDYNRHCVVMELVKGSTLCRLSEVPNVEELYDDLMNLIVRLGNYGVIHGDFNEFNIMITDEGKAILIDFPQMMSTSHPNAEIFFERDVKCVIAFFKRKFGYESSLYPVFSDIEREHNLDIEVAASGFTKQMNKDLDVYANEVKDYENVTSEEEDVTSEEGDVTSEEEDEANQEDPCQKEDNLSENDEEKVATEETNNIESSEHNDHYSEELCPKVETKKDESNEEGAACQAISSLTIENVQTLEEDDNFNSINLPSESGRYSVKDFDRFSCRSTCISNLSSASTFDPQEIHNRIKKERVKRKENQKGKSIKVKGEACAVTRKRRENKNIIKQERENRDFWG